MLCTLCHFPQFRLPYTLLQKPASVPSSRSPLHLSHRLFYLRFINTLTSLKLLRLSEYLYIAKWLLFTVSSDSCFFSKGQGHGLFLAIPFSSRLISTDIATPSPIHHAIPKTLSLTPKQTSHRSSRPRLHSAPSITISSPSPSWPLSLETPTSAPRRPIPAKSSPSPKKPPLPSLRGAARSPALLCRLTVSVP